MSNPPFYLPPFTLHFSCSGSGSGSWEGRAAATCSAGAVATGLLLLGQMSSHACAPKNWHLNGYLTRKSVAANGYVLYTASTQGAVLTSLCMCSLCWWNSRLYGSSGLVKQGYCRFEVHLLKMSGESMQSTGPYCALTYLTLMSSPCHKNLLLSVS